MEILKKGYKIFVLLFSIIIIAYSCRDGGVAAVVNFKPNPIRFSKEGGEYTIKVKGSRGPQWDYTNCTTHSGKEETMKMDTIDNIVHISNDWIEFMFNSGANCKYIDVKVKPNNSDMRRSLIFNVWSVALPTQLAVYQDENKKASLPQKRKVRTKFIPATFICLIAEYIQMIKVFVSSYF